MRLHYVDDSGDRSNSPDRPYFVLGGIGLDADALPKLQSSVRAVCERHEFTLGHPREVKFGHAGRSHDSPKKPNWMLRAGMGTFEERRAFLSACIDELHSVPSLSVIAAVVDQRKTYGDKTAVQHALQPLLERIEYECQERSEKAVIIADEEQGDRDVLRALSRSGTFYTSFPNLLEAIMFVPSTESIGVQVADIVAGSISRYLNSADPGYIRDLWPLFRRSGDGVVQGFGLKVYPSGPCADPPPQPVPWPEKDRVVHEIKARARGKAVVWTASGEPQTG